MDSSPTQSSSPSETVSQQVCFFAVTLMHFLEILIPKPCAQAPEKDCDGLPILQEYVSHSRHYACFTNKFFQNES